MSRYVKGAWNAVCDRCAFEYKSYELAKEWTGSRVCSKCFDHRHPQDFVKGVPDRQSPSWTRPEAADNYLTANEITEDDL
jgi:NMD protein affecting ribosome stability and mRNA decay